MARPPASRQQRRRLSAPRRGVIADRAHGRPPVGSRDGTPARASGDGATVRFPVSVKGVVLRDDRVVLMSNPRGEWELPGGKLEPDETPERCVAREIAEELGLEW